MRAFGKHIATRLRHLSRQDGSMLIEVIFSTLVLAMVSGAVLTGVTGSVKTATKNRERSVAATLAEQDQERMRSFKASTLSGYSQTRTLTVRGIPYSVASSTQWYFDSSGTKSCTSDTSQAGYMKLISKVTPQGSRPGPPVTATSLLAPNYGSFSNSQGSLAVMVQDRVGAPRSGLTVNLTGNSQSLSDTTNSSGCANFLYIPAGNYTVTVAAPGLVDRAGNASPSQTTGVVGGQQTLTTIELDVPVTINVNFDTKVGAATAVAAPAQYATIQSSGLASPGYKRQSLTTFPTTNNTFQWTSLYPFTSGYAAYGGNCDKNDPSAWVTGYTANAINVTPGGTYTITARLPAINVKVVRNTTNLAGADVKVTPTDSGCTSTTYPIQQTTAITATPPAALPKPGYPWGKYSLCADDSVSNPTTVHKVTTTTDIANTAAAGTAATTTLTINTSTGPTGNC
jgi:type II secretory pathway pseudopilin PulG